MRKGIAALFIAAAALQAQADERLALPGWMSVSAQYACPPAFALGPAGEMIVTSNVLAVLWRVDPRTLAVSVHKLSLDADTDKDVGFSALEYSREQDAYVAVSQATRSLWIIDRTLTRAHKVGALANQGETSCAIN